MACNRDCCGPNADKCIVNCQQRYPRHPEDYNNRVDCINDCQYTERTCNTRPCPACPRLATQNSMEPRDRCLPLSCQLQYDTCFSRCGGDAGTAECKGTCADNYRTCMLPCNTGTAQKRMQYASTAAQKQNGWRSAAQEQESTEPQSYGGCARCTGYPLQPVDRRPCPGSKPGPKPLPQDYFRPLRSRSYFDVWKK